jgi:hypothetical protein
MSDPESDRNEFQLTKPKRTYGKSFGRPDRALTKPLAGLVTSDNDLGQVLNAWPTLQPYLKAAILALATTKRSPT